AAAHGFDEAGPGQQIDDLEHVLLRDLQPLRELRNLDQLIAGARAVDQDPDRVVGGLGEPHARRASRRISALLKHTLPHISTPCSPRLEAKTLSPAVSPEGPPPGQPPRRLDARTSLCGSPPP